MESEYAQGMENSPEFITVYRSEEEHAEDDASDVRDQLLESQIDGVLYEESSSGAWEVRVPAAEAARAGQIIAVNQPEWASPSEKVDPSSDLDLTTIFTSASTNSEMEAMSIKGLLNAAGIPAFVVGNSTLPVLAFQVQVPRENADDAQRILGEAQAVGAQSADEAESAGETA